LRNARPGGVYITGIRELTISSGKISEDSQITRVPLNNTSLVSQKCCCIAQIAKFLLAKRRLITHIRTVVNMEARSIVCPSTESIHFKIVEKLHNSRQDIEVNWDCSCNRERQLFGLNTGSRLRLQINFLLSTLIWNEQPSSLPRGLVCRFRAFRDPFDFKNRDEILVWPWEAAFNRIVKHKLQQERRN
jgi:hypothetical protein